MTPCVKIGGSTLVQLNVLIEHDSHCFVLFNVPQSYQRVFSSDQSRDGKQSSARSDPATPGPPAH